MEKHLTITKDEVIPEFISSMNSLVTSIRLFNYDDFNQLPFTGSWTAGQVSEHLFKSLEGIPQLLTGHKKKVQRDPLEKCETIRSIFLDYEAKYQSPEFIIPSNLPKQVPTFVDGFERVKHSILDLAKQEDLSEECMGFNFPSVGELTGWEWICFASCHTQRHTRQIKNIYGKLHG